MMKSEDTMNLGTPRRADLRPLLEPRTVAIVGASESRHYSRSIIANLRQHGYPDASIFPVNPRYQSVAGLPCYGTLQDLPAGPDVVAVLVGRDQTRPMIDAAATAGAKAALVIADGFAEESAEGQAAQEELGRLAAAAGIAMLGPNTLGYVIPSTGAGLWCAGALPRPLAPGGIAVLAQSSGMLNLIMSMAGYRRFGIRASMSVGNGAVIGLPELIQHFAEDPGTSVIALVVESTDRPRALASALATARRAGKPVVVLKIGVSELGRRNAIAHTGRMAGPEQGWFALLERMGAIGVRDLDDLMETLALLDGAKALTDGGPGRPDSPGIAVATISGGETSLICDVAAQEGLALAPLTAATLQSLRAKLNKDSLIGNPLDLQNTRTSRPEVFWESLRTLCADETVDLLAVRLNLSEQPSDELRGVYRKVVETASGEGVVTIVLSRAYERLDPAWGEFFRELGTPFVMSYRNSIRALVRLVSWMARAEETLEEPTAVPVQADTGAQAAAVPRSLDTAVTGEWLAQAGIRYVASEIADSVSAAGQAADRVGYPVAVKAVLPDLVHKSDVGGVALGLTSRTEVERACATMAASLAGADGALTPSYEIQQMVTGMEMIVGMIHDPSWGPVIMVGSGGVFAENIHDVVWDLPPLSKPRAQSMIERLQGYPLLAGARGRPPADVDALAEVLSGFAAAVARDPGLLHSADLNPVIIGAKGDGACVVDAVLLAVPAAPKEEAHARDH
jgi:acetate---CoA ligase (ADP-forming)